MSRSVFCLLLCAFVAAALATKTDITSVIRSRGFPQVQSHKVVTEDGYVLTLHRIPAGGNANGKVVFLQHGLEDSSACWTLGLRDEALAYILADLGYDVWLGNSRGNVYSSAHERLNVNDAAFWQFSFDEMAKYDLPASIEYVRKATGANKVGYVGHSQGTMIGFIEFSSNADLASSISAFVALAPVTTITHTTNTLLRVMTSVRADVLLQFLGTKSFNPSALLAMCRFTGWACSEFICMAAGCENPSNVNMALNSQYFPAGTSMQNIVHFGQLLRSGKFQAYDWGHPDDNARHYNQITPPEYDVSTLMVPTHLFAGGKDALADPSDVADAMKRLPDWVTLVEFPAYGHGDFTWAKDAKTSLYPQVAAIFADEAIWTDGFTANAHAASAPLSPLAVVAFVAIGVVCIALTAWFLVSKRDPHAVEPNLFPVTTVAQAGFGAMVV